MNQTPKSSILSNNPNQLRITIGFSVILTAIIYFLLHGQYMLHHVDDPWFGSRIYYYFTTGINMDTVFDAPEVEDKVQIFYILFSNLYGSLLELFGWNKANAHLICTFLIAFSAPVWFFIFRKMRFSFEVSLLMGLTLMLMPAYFKAANHLRPDALAFFLGSVSLLLFLSRYYFLAGFMIMVAFESHLMTCTFGVYMVTWVGCNWKEYYSERTTFFKNIGLFIGGMILGFGYYVYLNQDALTVERVTSLLMGHRNMGTQEFFKHIFTTYFVQSRWYLHIWEFVLIVMGFRFYFKNKLHKKLPFIWILLAALFAASLILSRPNRNYMIYFLPAFLMLVYYSFEQVGKLESLAKALIILFVVQYGMRYYQYYGFDLRGIMTEVENTITDKNLAVVGIPDNWFPAREHEFFPIYRSFEGFPKEKLSEFYLIRNDYKFLGSINAYLESLLAKAGLVEDTVVEKRARFYNDHFDYFESNCQCDEINRFPAYKTHEVVIYRCVRLTKDGQR